MPGAFYVPALLPMPIIAVVALLTAVLTVLAMARAKARGAIYVIGISWLRYVMQAFHTITYQPLTAGVSINAVGTIGFFLAGLAVINWRNLALKMMTPFYIVIAVAFTSMVMNGGELSQMIEGLTKYGFLVVVTLATYSGLRNTQDGAFMRLLLWTFVPVVLLQIASIGLNIGKTAETAPGSTSYIGGYNHESIFSVILATGLVVTCLATKLNRAVQFGLILIFVAGVIFANYRTTLLAIAPLLAMFFGMSTLQQFPKRDRPLMICFVLVLGMIALGFASVAFTQRFQDFTVLFSGDVNLIKPPDQYTIEETRLFSGRAKIWSMYIYGWSLSTPFQHMIGLGPEAWKGVFALYAHNTLVNQLYEYGIAGVLALLFLWGSMLAAALRVRHPQRATLVGAHLMFLILNMATMPMWMIEGNILYGIICGYTLYLLSLQGRPQQATPQTTLAPARPRQGAA
jgi:hypothetical protein